MDENIVVHAIQRKSARRFQDKYTIFESEQARDEEFKFVTWKLDERALADISRVLMFVRVETEMPKEEVING